jgi:hypothetical protein
MLFKDTSPTIQTAPRNIKSFTDIQDFPPSLPKTQAYFFDVVADLAIDHGCGSAVYAVQTRQMVDYERDSEASYLRAVFGRASKRNSHNPIIF